MINIEEMLFGEFSEEEAKSIKGYNNHVKGINAEKRIKAVIGSKLRGRGYEIENVDKGADMHAVKKDYTGEVKKERFIEIKSGKSCSLRKAQREKRDEVREKDGVKYEKVCTKNIPFHKLV